MVKTRKILLTIMMAITLVCTVLGILHGSANATRVSAATPTVTCQGITNDMNNNILKTLCGDDFA